VPTSATPSKGNSLPAWPCCITNRISYRAAEDWFDNKFYLFDVEANVGPSSNRERIKVAILDTGVDKTDVEIQKAMNSEHPAISNHSCRGFPETLLPLEDKHGHGTQCAALLLRIAPNVELFIGRVATNNGTLYRENKYGEDDKKSHFSEAVKVSPLRIVRLKNVRRLIGLSNAGLT